MRLKRKKKKTMFLANHSLLDAIGVIVKIIYKKGNTEEERKRWIDSIGQIYTCSCVSKDTIPELIKREQKEIDGNW